MIMPDCLLFVDERRSVKRMGSAAGFSFPPHPLPPVPFLALASCVRATSPWLSLSLSPAKRKRKRLLRRLVLKVPCTLRWGNFKTEVFTLKTYQMFFVHTTSQEFNILDFCLRKTRSRRPHDCREANVFEKLRFQSKCFPSGGLSCPVYVPP